MKTRSSRFFIILLHLLGVSNHHLPSWYYDYLTNTSASERSSFYSGIRGVHPHSITLERLDLREVGGLDGVDWLGDHRGDQEQQQSLSQSSDSAAAATTTTTQETREPFWLQDSRDGKCLGPSGGFSECGDATLWFILRRGTQRKSLRMGPFGVEEVLERADPEEPYRYALQIVDNDYDGASTISVETSASMTSSRFFSWRHQRQRRQQKDCLVPAPKSRRRHGALELGSCGKQKTAWSWRVDPQGFLYLPNDVSHTNGRECLRRSSTGSSAVLSACQDNGSEADSQHHEQQRLVQFSLVRYHATANPSVAPSNNNKVRPEQKKEKQAETSNRPSKPREGLPSTKDKAHSHASDPVAHSPIFEMNLAGRPLRSAIPTPQDRKDAQSQPFAALKDTNPILFVGKTQPEQSNPSKEAASSDPRATTPPPQPSVSSLGKLRKIEMNPYIAASQDEIWVDPLTGLQYPTDLCKYLGHDRRESGRHTLVGVGQFMKTMLKIKVYGIALYVSKRDVLADPAFQQYAGLSSEDLRKRPDFYEKLRSAGGFDRTLVLKTNMQLATETMRSSLDSDWKMLSEEAKALLIDTSMRPRPAEQQMLEQIQRADNPSRCSCAQSAPEEYQADPTCCARGIELVFTWRKNGDLEVRLNGRLMDSFPRPDIGNGIFFEYLRTDDPFSPDFLERAVDGFPFLLAPLAQIQGITSSVLQAAAPEPEPAKEPAHAFIIKTVGGAAEAFTSHAANLAAAMQQGASDTAANAANTVHSAGDAMRQFGEEAERKRVAAWNQMVAISQQHPADVFAQMVARAKGEKRTEPVIPVEEPEEIVLRSNAPHGKIFRQTTSKWFGETMDAPDEIGPMIHPTMNKTILSLVHFYLLLILIVSFPPTNASKTRFVVRRSCKMIPVSSSELSLGGLDLDSSEKETIVPRREQYRPVQAEYVNPRGSGKKVAPEPPGSDDECCLYPGYDSDPASEGFSPQRIHIDLSSQDGRESTTTPASKKKPSSVKRFFQRPPRSTPKATRRSQSLDCPESERSSASDGSGSGNTKKSWRRKSGEGKPPIPAVKKGSANDKVKKNLSYFL
ncbi:expressed unknown protein [Seminavis robusta]|uniref:Uncharacterized protein n=1 Tax=Seminavis robusta TaxID=568900 RepID=A0A9N8HII1_9STRA|nr:expressed unknown protein [Seminavis robusta]|eukprot:Sro502_g155600.1 n/a (1072) ;mRNA; f:36299-39716